MSKCWIVSVHGFDAYVDSVWSCNKKAQVRYDELHKKLKRIAPDWTPWIESAPFNESPVVNNKKEKN